MQCLHISKLQGDIDYVGDESFSEIGLYFGNHTPILGGLASTCMPLST